MKRKGETGKKRKHSIADLTASVIITRVRGKYGKLSHKDIDYMNNQLNQPFSTEQTIVELLKTHRNIYKELEEHGCILPENEKIKKLKEALMPNGNYNMAFHLFADRNSDILATKFADFCNYIEMYQVEASTLMSYANAATTVTRHAPINNMQYEMPKKFCWSHGIGYHDGHECTYRATASKKRP